MLANEFVQLLAVVAVVDKVDFDHIHIAEVVEVVVLVPNVSYTTRHTGSEVASRFAQYYYATARHILAAVVACALDNGCCARVAHSEAFANLTVYVEFAACCAIQSGVAGYDVVLGCEVASNGREYRNAST